MPSSSNNDHQIDEKDVVEVASQERDLSEAPLASTLAGARSVLWSDSVGTLPLAECQVSIEQIHTSKQTHCDEGEGQKSLIKVSDSNLLYSSIHFSYRIKNHSV